MIEMISGVTRVGNRTYSPADGPVTLDSDAEKWLISAGVARHVYPDMETERGITDDLRGSDGVSDAGQGETLPNAESVTEGAETPETAADSGNDHAPAAESEAVFYDEKELLDMTNARLKEIAEGMDIDTSAMRKKADYVEAILNQQAVDSGGTADDEEPPDLGAEEPVT